MFYKEIHHNDCKEIVSYINIYTQNLINSLNYIINQLESQSILQVSSCSIYPVKQMQVLL